MKRVERIPNQKTAIFISIIVVILASISSLGGLFLDGLYRDNTFVTTAWKGNDLVTLVVAVPMLITSILFIKRGSIRAILVWLGMLQYMLYNFAYYLFGAVFNWFFLLYVALFTLSIFALIFGLINIDVEMISKSVQKRMPVKWISGYMLFIALGLSAVYFIQSLNFIITGQVPAIIEMAAHPTNVVFALDLSLLVPILLLGGIWLLKKNPWGYVLSGMALIKGATYTLGLTTVSIMASRAGISGASEEVPFWFFITIIGAIVCVLLYWNLDSSKVTAI